jgi:hypothetical protein
VAQLHGFRAFDYTTSFAKSVNVADRFEAAASAIYESEGCSGTEALKKARQLNPKLYKGLQSV